jgi:hypothetical protein
MTVISFSSDILVETGSAALGGSLEGAGRTSAEFIAVEGPLGHAGELPMEEGG